MVNTPSPKSADSAADRQPVASPRSPLAIPNYRLFYLGAVSTSMAYTMQSAMAGWLMTHLSASSLLLGLVQASSTLPFLLFGLISGSISDLLSRRHILVMTHLVMGMATAAVAVMSWSGWLAPWSLVLCTMLCGLGYTFYQPAQQASINGLIPRVLLPKAIALGSIAFNAARSVGPALAGLISAALGEGPAVLVSALFFVPMLPSAWRALRSQPEERPGRDEPLRAALMSGLRYSCHARVARAALIMNFYFCFCAAALWAMFPLVAQQRLGLAAGGYGFLYSTFGLGAVVSALGLPHLLSQGQDTGRVVRLASGLWCLAVVILGLARWIPMAVLGTFMGGMAWVGVLASLSTVAQSIAPDWVRARAVANNQIPVQAGLALGSLFWGAVVSRLGLQSALILSGSLLAVAAVASLRLSIRLGHATDVTPDPSPGDMFAGQGICHDAQKPSTGLAFRFCYCPMPDRLRDFMPAMDALRESRRRNGAVRWRLQPDPEKEGVWQETFELPSLVHWQRFIARMMQADRIVWERVRSLQVPDCQAGGAGARGG